MNTSSSLGRDAWLRLKANHMAMVSLGILIAIFLVSVLGPIFVRILTTNKT